MRALVTGASGFIGHHAVTALASAGWEVHGTCWSRRPTLPGVTLHPTDLLDRKQIERLVQDVRATHLLHLAWYTKPGAYWMAPENHAWVDASLHLAREFTRAGGRRMVVAGTCAEYSWYRNESDFTRNLEIARFRESSTLIAPASLYGQAKCSLATALTTLGRNLSLGVGWGRVFSSFGPHEPETRLLPSVICALLKNQEISCTHGEQIRDVLYVTDVARAFVTLLSSDERQPVNICSGKPIQLRTLVGAVAGLLGRPNLVHFGKRPISPDEPAIIVGDNERLLNLGWHPQAEFNESLIQTIDWWREKVANQR